MRAVIGIGLALAIVSSFTLPQRADSATSIYVDIQQATGIARPVDAQLVSVAQLRAKQALTHFLATHQLSHAGKPASTAEILAWNQGYTDPVQTAVTSWMHSPPHRAILVDPGWWRIGCGLAFSGSLIVAACEFWAARPPAVRVLLPNTAFRP